MLCSGSPCVGDTSASEGNQGPYELLTITSNRSRNALVYVNVRAYPSSCPKLPIGQCQMLGTGYASALNLKPRCDGVVFGRSCSQNPGARMLCRCRVVVYLLPSPSSHLTGTISSMNPFSILGAVDVGLKALYKLYEVIDHYRTNKKECERLYQHATATLKFIRTECKDGVSEKLARRLLRLAR